MNTTSLQPLLNTVPLYPPSENTPEVAAIRQFAQDNAFTYQSVAPEMIEYSHHTNATNPGWVGAMSPMLPKQVAYNAVTGRYEDYNLQMFSLYNPMTNGNAAYEDPTEEQARAYVAQQSLGIIRIQLPKILPQVVLDSIRNDGGQSTIPTSFKRNQRLQLEGDFDSYFDLYAPLGLQVNVLTLLAPNAMQILKDHAGMFDIEFYGNEMIVVTKFALYDPATMKALNEFLSEQMPYITRLMGSWNYTPKKTPFDMLDREFIQGTSIRIGNKSLSPGAFLLVVGVFFGAFALLMFVGSVYEELKGWVFVAVILLFAGMYGLMSHSVRKPKK